MVAVLAVPVLIVLLAVALLVLRDDEGRAVLLERMALGITAVYGLLAAVFIAGETFDDPGGWAAFGLVLTWALPLAALCVVAWLRPHVAVRLLGAATLVALALAVWFAVAPEAWRSFEDRTGPVRTLVAFVVMVPLGLLGWRRPVAAGALLLTLGVVPVLLSGLTEVGRVFAVTSANVVAGPSVLVGALYLVAAGFAGHGSRARPDRDARRRATASDRTAGSDEALADIEVSKHDAITPKHADTT